MTASGPVLLRRALLGAMASLPVARLAGAAEGGKLASGTPFETPFHWVDSGAEGPTVMVVAGIHGNEGAPPIAASKLTGVSLKRGRLFLLPEANRPALAAKSRHIPGSEHPDLNRNFPTADRTARGEMAPLLWEKLVDVSPDWVLDLHEGWGFNASSPSMGSSVVLATTPSVEKVARSMANRVKTAINATISDEDRKFTLIEPGPKGSLARSVAEERATPALVFETTWTQPEALRVAQQTLMVRTALTALAMI